MTRQLSGKRLFIVDAFCGANADTRLSVRFITEVAWQAHFVKNMFIRPGDEELANFAGLHRDERRQVHQPQWKEQGLNSENFVAFNLTERIQLIGGTWYGGEMKKRDVLDHEPAAAEGHRLHALPANVGKKRMSPSSSAFPVPARPPSLPIRNAV